jgi:uncharacterized protein (TIGR02453 family)
MDPAFILDFLSDLAQNNNRDWMETERARYLKAKAGFEQIVERMILGISAFEPEISVLQPKDCIFRIHRDIRFGADKTPYKTNFGASINRGGKKSPRPTHYLHLQPGESFVAGGVYMPPGELLRRLRQEVDYNVDEFSAILNDPEFSRFFGGLEGEKLKKAPVGFDAASAHIEWLKHKSYIVLHALSDDLVRSGDFEKHVLEAFRAAQPFNRFFARVFEDMDA